MFPFHEPLLGTGTGFQTRCRQPDKGVSATCRGKQQLVPCWKTLTLVYMEKRKEGFLHPSLHTSGTHTERGKMTISNLSISAFSRGDFPKHEETRTMSLIITSCFYKSAKAGSEEKGSRPHLVTL